MLKAEAEPAEVPAEVQEFSSRYFLIGMGCYNARPWLEFGTENLVVISDVFVNQKLGK